MIALHEINRTSETYGVPLETIEKDYMISWILACISRTSLVKNFAFYGGTAVKQIYFKDHRYSEDIDLISAKGFDADFLTQSLLNSFPWAKAKANLDFAIDARRTLSQGSRTQIFVSFSGFDEIVGSPKEVRIDFALEMGAYGETKERKVLENYSDLKGLVTKLQVHSLNTILAGKLGLLMNSSRKEPRDLFDVWFLLNRTRQFQFNLQKVRKYFNQKYGFPPGIGVLRPHLRNRLYKERWGTRLAKQIAHLPSIDSVIRDVEAKLEKIFEHGTSSHTR